MFSTRLITAAAITLVGVALLAGCSGADSAAVPASAQPLPKATSTTSHAAASPSASPSTGTVGTASASGRPSAPPYVETSTNTVAGLTHAIDRSSHAGLAICEGQYDSTLVSTGDIRGDGSTQYLVDTTCAGATASTPDEVALYAASGSTIARDGVIYTYTVNRPRLTTQPYLDGAHTVVLTYDDGARFSLVTITPTTIVQGELQNS